MTNTGESKPRKGGSRLTTGLVLIWVVFALGVPTVVFAGAMASFTFDTPDASQRATTRAYFAVALFLAVGLLATGLGLAIWGRRKASGIVFGTVLLLVVCGSLAPTSRAHGKPHSILESIFPGLVEPYTPPAPGPAGCMGAPEYQGNCKGG